MGNKELDDEIGNKLPQLELTHSSIGIKQVPNSTQYQVYEVTFNPTDLSFSQFRVIAVEPNLEAAALRFKISSVELGHVL